MKANINRVTLVPRNNLMSKPRQMWRGRYARRHHNPQGIVTHVYSNRHIFIALLVRATAQKQSI